MKVVKEGGANHGMTGLRSPFCLSSRFQGLTIRMIKHRMPAGRKVFFCMCSNFISRLVGSEGLLD